MEGKKKERHPLRALVRLAIMAGIIGFVVSFINGKKLEYTGLTESEARRKFEEKLGPKMGEERAAEVADQVIPKLKERGMVVADPIAETPSASEDSGG